MGVNSPAVYGLNSHLQDLPSEVHYFQSFFLRNTIQIFDNENPIVTILSINSNVCLLNMCLCDNSYLYKSEGALKRGLLVKCELKVEFKIKYVGGADGRSIRFAKKDFFKPVYLTVPEFIDDQSVKTLMRKNRFSSFIIVENLKTQVSCDNSINFSMASLINISFN